MIRVHNDAFGSEVYLIFIPIVHYLDTHIRRNCCGYFKSESCRILSKLNYLSSKK